MTNENRTPFDVAAQVRPLRRLEQLGEQFRQEPAPATTTDATPDPRVAEYVSLQDGLPLALFYSLRSRIRHGQRLIASARNGKCGACYTAMPRGDHSALLVGREPVYCQYCGVLLYTEAEEVEGLAAGGGAAR